MKDVREVLQEKLRDLTRVTKEINALRIVIPLMLEVDERDVKPADFDLAPAPEKGQK